MSYFTIARYVGVAAVIAFLTWAVIDRFALARVVASQRQCVAAARTADKPLDVCDEVIAARTMAARRADACEAALQRGDLFAERGACGAQVKLLQARADAAIADAADLNQQLAKAGADRDAAVQRAEARAASQADRNAANARIIQAAPRQPDGRVHCDAACVRGLAGG